MLTSFRRSTAVGKPSHSTTPRLATFERIPTAHRQRYAVEVAYYHSQACLADCLAVPVSGRRVVLFGGQGMLPAQLTEMTDRVVRAADVDPFKAAVVAVAGLKDGDTLTVLLPSDWAGPAAEEMLDYARRWFATPHSSEDEAV
ncbi:MAG: hypothetical protein MUF18_16610 [Fimbriiglobus sp.]|jgi:hypothetical protein|nr:hypothetical protein [Fimbriiglobus sp.]